MQFFDCFDELLYDLKVWQKDFARVGTFTHDIVPVRCGPLFIHRTKCYCIHINLPLFDMFFDVTRLSSLAICSGSDTRRVIRIVYHNVIRIHASTGHDV